ncbi:hypothetical protein B0T16DRAFT_413503 [Cercophora newfieldiana]|uniref:Alpha-l-rhamnosidase c n=1 Tax=Cercophora newfieldiana TaxID=92897 RepID=A0AA39Y7J5_9PEZI|nr:hypothetical protein B0T16DRAFT_413503 [Cercophora newfieldiana]
MAHADSGAEPPAASNPNEGSEPGPYQTRKRSTSRGSSVVDVVRRLSQEFESSRPHEAFAAATSDIASTMAAGQPKAHTDKATGASGEKNRLSDNGSRPAASSEAVTIVPTADAGDAATKPFENGYHFPPKYSRQESTKQTLTSFWKFFTTPMGFFWTIYGLNVVAWGGMLFLLLCNAAPAMCYPNCDDIDSPRRKWVEWDSQILTALFCVPAFGLAPWRFRDFWYLLKYRFKSDQTGIRRLAGIHAEWFRLKGSDQLAADVGPDHIPADTPVECIPIPESSMAVAPRTGIRAPATSVWKMDFVVWSMVMNTLAQVGLCGIMWGMNRYDRPSWTTGFLVALGMVIAMVGGFVMFLEGKKVKSTEGVALTDRDHQKLADDKEKGVYHYNNIKGKKPKRKQQDPEK